MSIVMITVIAAVMISSALAVTTTTPAFAEPGTYHVHTQNGVNGGSGGPGNSDFGHSHHDQTPSGGIGSISSGCVRPPCTRA
jgi:hypothetical protein